MVVFFHFIVCFYFKCLNKNKYKITVKVLEAQYMEYFPFTLKLNYKQIKLNYCFGNNLNIFI